MLQTIILIALAYAAIVVLALSLCVVAGRADRRREQELAGPESPAERPFSSPRDDVPELALTTSDAAFFERLGRHAARGLAYAGRRMPPGLR